MREGGFVTSGQGDLVKVQFRREIDEDGWPGVASEGLWGRLLPDGLVRLENNPWFVRGIANGDTVRTEIGEDGLRHFAELVEWSGYCVVRVIPWRKGPLAGDRQAVLDLFAAFGITGEGTERPVNIVSLEIPPDADFAAIKRLLVEGERDGRWAYEEGCIGDDWAAAGPG